MTTDTYAPSAVGERIRDLCRQSELQAADACGRDCGSLQRCGTC